MPTRTGKSHVFEIRLGAGLLSLALTTAALAQGATRPGDLTSPFQVPSFPFVHAYSTAGRSQNIDRYSAASATSEAGPEVIYAVGLPSGGNLIATVEGDNAQVDIDVHILSGLQIDAQGQATQCLARGNLSAEATVAAGNYWISVDTYLGAHKAGAYRLRIDFQPEDAWYERPLAQGLTLKTRVYPSLYGSRQTASVLAVDLASPGVEIRALGASGCKKTSALAQAAGAQAAVNAGFFDGACHSISVLRSSGVLLAANSKNRSAFGINTQGQPMIETVPAGQDWPAAVEAIGGVPRILSGGAVDVRWSQEGSVSSFANSRHPRTAVGIDAQGQVIFATLDGRTAAGAGMTLDELAQWMLGLGVQDALNLDGGGSTTLWAAGEPLGGIVNYPSDNGQADHEGERSVMTAFGVFAPALDLAPVYLTAAPLGAATEGTTYVYEVAAADPEGQGLTLQVTSPALSGALSIFDRGDGTARLEYTPRWPDGRQAAVELTLEASTGPGAASVQLVSIPVTFADADADGMPDTWEALVGLDSARNDAGEDPDGDGASNLAEYSQGSDPFSAPSGGGSGGNTGNTGNSGGGTATPGASGASSGSGGGGSCAVGRSHGGSWWAAAVALGIGLWRRSSRRAGARN